MNIEIKNQGLTNSQRFTDMNGNVDIEKAYDAYMPSDKVLKANLRFMIENKYTEEQIRFQLEQLAGIYYTLFVNYKDNKPL